MTEGFKDNGRTFLFSDSDLACERRRADIDIQGVELKKEAAGEFEWERIRITTEAGARSIGRPIGNYDTLNLKKINELEIDEISDASDEISRELCLALDRISVIPERLLIVGLGNKELTPDSIGPRVADRINATMHLKGMDKDFFYGLDFSEIAVCAPGVTAFTGMDATDVITALCDRIEPDAVIAIDAIASRSPKRLGSTIQISDTGIYPGSGIGNARLPLSSKTLGVPVIAIGVPTVINAKITASEQSFALRGNYEYDTLFVSPKEIDEIANISSKIIADGINQAFGIF